MINKYARPVGGDKAYINNKSNTKEEHCEHVWWAYSPFLVEVT